MYMCRSCNKAYASNCVRQKLGFAGAKKKRATLLFESETFISVVAGRLMHVLHTYYVYVCYSMLEGGGTRETVHLNMTKLLTRPRPRYTMLCYAMLYALV